MPVQKIKDFFYIAVSLITVIGVFGAHTMDLFHIAPAYIFEFQIISFVVFIYIIRKHKNNIDKELVKSRCQTILLFLRDRKITNSDKKILYGIKDECEKHNINSYIMHEIESLIKKS